MYQVVTELSYYVLDPVDAGSLVDVIRLGLYSIYCSRICCHLRCVWIVAIRCFVTRFIQLCTNYIVISPILSYCRLWSFSVSCGYYIKLSWFIPHTAWCICNLQDLLRCQLYTTYCFLYAESFTDVHISRRVLGMFTLCVVAVAGFPWVPSSFLKCLSPSSWHNTHARGLITHSEEQTTELLTMWLFSGMLGIYRTFLGPPNLILKEHNWYLPLR